MKIKSIYDIISFSIFIINIYTILTLQYDLFLSNIIVIIIHKYIKHYTTGLYPNIFKRPNSACDCNIFNDGGIVSDKSGFPSGHMISISLFMNGFLFKNNKKVDVTQFIIYNIPCILMGVARYQKKCHNLIQIIFGYLFGLSSAYLLKIFYYNKIHYQNTENGREEYISSENVSLINDSNNINYKTINV
jgi:membrane-associated phospholipid phosphatase